MKISWVQRLKRVFSIDIEVCSHCGGSVKVIACIEDQALIDIILTHLREKEQEIPIFPLLTSPSEHHLTPYRFWLERNPVQQHTISKEATEKVWLASVRPTVQHRTDMNFSMTEVGRISQ